MFFAPDENTRKKLDALAAPHYEALRLFELPSPELGEELLGRSAELRKAFPASGSGAAKAVVAVLDHIVPELAARLGARSEAASIRPAIMAKFTAEEFRQFVAALMQWRPLSTLSAEQDADGWMALQLLSRDVAAGNPLAFALDRVAPPAQDWIAHKVQAAATAMGHEPTSVWSPALLRKAPPSTPQEVIALHIGKTIRSVSIQGQGQGPDETVMKDVHIIFDDGMALDLSNAENDCCKTSISCDDDLAFYVGSSFQGAEFRPVAPVRMEDDEFFHDVGFLEVSTSAGSFTVASHVLHNGYYGDFDLEAKTVAPRPEPEPAVGFHR